MALNNRVETTTREQIMPMVIDTVLKGNVFATRMLAKAKKFSSSRLKFPIKYQKGQAGSSFSGFDTFSTGASDTRVNMEFEPKFYEVGVALPLTELSMNDTEGKIIDLAILEMQSRAQDMADEIGTLFYADGTGNGSKDFLGLEAIVDDGTNAATIGGLARATYTTLNSTVTASGGTLTLALMSTLYHGITDGGQAPTAIFTTPTIFSLVEQLLTANERYSLEPKVYAGGLTLASGATALQYKGLPIFADRKCTSGVMYFVNENYLNFYGMPLFGTSEVSVGGKIIEGNDYSKAPAMGFSWSKWIKPDNAAALQGFMYLGGELISDNPGRHGKLTGITGV